MQTNTAKISVMLFVVFSASQVTDHNYLKVR